MPKAAVYIRPGSLKPDNPFAHALPSLVRRDSRDPDKLNPFYAAFLQAHDYRTPIPFTAFPFTKWMERMYRLFFRAQGYKHPDAPRGSLAYNLNVATAQEQGGFTQWLLDESIKVDCPRDMHVMGSTLIGEPYRFLRHGKGLLCCPTCGLEWPVKYMVAAKRHARSCASLYLEWLHVEQEKEQAEEAEACARFDDLAETTAGRE